MCFDECHLTLCTIVCMMKTYNAFFWLMWRLMRTCSGQCVAFFKSIWLQLYLCEPLWTMSDCKCILMNVIWLCAPLYAYGWWGLIMHIFGFCEGWWKLAVDNVWHFWSPLDFNCKQWQQRCFGECHLTLCIGLYLYDEDL